MLDTCFYRQATVNFYISFNTFHVQQSISFYTKKTRLLQKYFLISYFTFYLILIKYYSIKLTNSCFKNIINKAEYSAIFFFFFFFFLSFDIFLTFTYILTHFMYNSLFPSTQRKLGYHKKCFIISYFTFNLILINYNSKAFTNCCFKIILKKAE